MIQTGWIFGTKKMIAADCHKAWERDNLLLIYMKTDIYCFNYNVQQKGFNVNIHLVINIIL